MVWYRRAGVIILIPLLFACAALSQKISRLDHTGYYISKNNKFKVKGPETPSCWEERYEANYLFLFYHWQDCRKDLMLGYDGRYFARLHSRWEYGSKEKVTEWIEYYYGGPVVPTISKKGIQGWVVRDQPHRELTYTTEPWTAWYFICFNPDNDLLVLAYDGRQKDGIKDFETAVDTLEFLK